MYADDTYGLFYGYGYAIATDRLFQMEMSKRTGWGSVSEVLGPDYLEVDKATHSRFNPADIQKQLAQLPEEEKAVFAGYVAGFNKRINKVLANQEQARLALGDGPISINASTAPTSSRAVFTAFLCG